MTSVNTALIAVLAALVRVLELSVAAARRKATSKIVATFDADEKAFDVKQAALRQAEDRYNAARAKTSAARMKVYDVVIAADKTERIAAKLKDLVA